MKKVLYYNSVPGDKHLKTNIEIFSSIGLKCKPFTFFPTALLFGKVDFLYLNWFENLGSRNSFIATLRYLLKRSIFLIAKVRGVKIVSSHHNKTVHNKKYFNLCNSLMKMVCSQSDKIVVFTTSGVSELEDYLERSVAESKAFFVPPVNYIGIYPYVEHDWIKDIDSKPGMKLLMFGYMKDTYKNVDMVIDVANSFPVKDAMFILAGPTVSEAQAQGYMSRISKDANIHAEFRFIADDEMAHLLSVADITLAPYELSSVSNSGVARLAFSYGKSIVCSCIPSVENIPNEFIYKYTYSDVTDHEKKFKEALERAYSDYKQSPNSMVEKGDALKKIMMKENSPEKIRERYQQLFNELSK